MELSLIYKFARASRRTHDGAIAQRRA
jgi:hypothetical protein